LTLFYQIKKFLARKKEEHSSRCDEKPIKHSTHKYFINSWVVIFNPKSLD